MTMKKFARVFLTVLGITLAAAALSAIPSRSAKAGPSGPSVTVANTPLPVQGSVGVNNFPSTLTGSSVPVTGTVTANVTFPSSIGVTNAVNDTSQPVPLITREDKDLVDEPFATSLCAGGTGLSTCAVIAGFGGISFVPPGSFTVPTTDSAGNTVKALVIQFVSGICGSAETALSTTVGSNGINGVTQAINFLDITPAGYVNETTSIAVGPGGTVAIFPASPSNPCWLTLNGYLAH